MKTAEQMENLQILRTFWMSLRRPQVYLGLWCYEEPRETGPSCGTIACIGGWTALMPEFQAKGVKRNDVDGSPYMGDPNDMENYRGPRATARELFGATHFFSPVGSYERVHLLSTEGSDWEIALRRIDHALTDWVRESA